MVIYFVYVVFICVNPKLLIYPLTPTFPFGNRKFVFKVYFVITNMRKHSEKDWIHVCV